MSSADGKRPKCFAGLRIAVLTVTAAVACLRAPAPASADQVSDLQAQASSISEQLVQAQLQIDAYRQQASVLSVKVAAEAQAIGGVALQISRDEQVAQGYGDELRRQAVSSYMSAGASLTSPEIALFTGNEETAEAADMYSDIAVGNIRTTLHQVQTVKGALRSNEATMQAALNRDRSDQMQRALDLSRATGAQHHMTVLQSQVTTQLAAAIAARTTPAAPTSPGADPALNSFLRCVVQAESSGNYGAVSPTGTYMGAFQFSQPTWNEAASAAARPDLIGVRPNTASKADQDSLAVTLYGLDGERPWFDPCRK
jgi:Transglycosylase-like domain